MSLAEIKDAVTDLKPTELAELAAFIQAQDKAAEKTDAAASQEDWPEFPVFDSGPLDGALHSLRAGRRSGVPLNADRG